MTNKILKILFTTLPIFWTENAVFAQSPVNSPPNTVSGKNILCRKPMIEITVSPLVSKTSLRLLDLSWDVGKHWLAGDWIGLYNGPPDLTLKPLFSTGINVSNGWVRTDIAEGRRFNEEPNFEKTCLGFWASYWRTNSTIPVTTSCLTTNPTWMGDLKNVIRNLKLKDMFIPGTHDSAAFHLAYTPFIETRYHKYVFAQDENVMEQLIHGARFLDFRIGYYKGVWWLNHGVVKVRPLEHVLDEIKLFLNSTQEILIIDFHKFPVGFKKKETHIELVRYLHKELGPYLAPPWLGWNANLAQLWDRNKRLILAYNDKSVVAEHYDILWMPVVQKWPNVRSLNKLHAYFSGIFKILDEEKQWRNTALAWSAMAELTPDTWGVISDKYKGLRNMADIVNHNVTEWFRGDWGAKCNAVAVDFLRSTGIVEAAITWNKLKASQSLCSL